MCNIHRVQCTYYNVAKNPTTKFIIEIVVTYLYYNLFLKIHVCGGFFYKKNGINMKEEVIFIQLNYIINRKFKAANYSFKMQDIRINQCK